MGPPMKLWMEWDAGWPRGDHGGQSRVFRPNFPYAGLDFPPFSGKTLEALWQNTWNHVETQGFQGTFSHLPWNLMRLEAQVTDFFVQCFNSPFFRLGPFGLQKGGPAPSRSASLRTGQRTVQSNHMCAFTSMTGTSSPNYHDFTWSCCCSRYGVGSILESPRLESCWQVACYMKSIATTRSPVFWSALVDESIQGQCTCAWPNFSAFVNSCRNVNRERSWTALACKAIRLISPEQNVWFNWESCFSQHHGQVFKTLGDGCYARNARNARNSRHWNAQLTVMWSFETKPLSLLATSLALWSRWCISLLISGGSLSQLDQHQILCSRTYGSVLKAQNKQTNELARHWVLRQEVVSEQGTASYYPYYYYIYIHIYIDKHPTIPTITISYFIIITRYYNDYHSDFCPMIASYLGVSDLFFVKPPTRPTLI